LAEHHNTVLFSLLVLTVSGSLDLVRGCTLTWESPGGSITHSCDEVHGKYSFMKKRNQAPSTKVDRKKRILDHCQRALPPKELNLFPQKLLPTCTVILVMFKCAISIGNRTNYEDYSLSTHSQSLQTTFPTFITPKSLGFAHKFPSTPCQDPPL